MTEMAVKLKGEALKALETIRGHRDESVAETVSRALSIAELIATESAKGARVQFREPDGSVKELSDP